MHVILIHTDSTYPAFNQQRIVTPGSCHTETRYANAPYSMTETNILKDKIVNLAYTMYFECSVVLNNILVPSRLVNEDAA